MIRWGNSLAKYKYLVIHLLFLRPSTYSSSLEIKTHFPKRNSEFCATNMKPSPSGESRDHTLNFSMFAESKVGDCMSSKLMGPPPLVLVGRAIVPQHGVFLALYIRQSSLSYQYTPPAEVII